jgi:hypothetical protein
MYAAHHDLTALELDSVYWKIVLGIDEGVLKDGGILMCFSDNGGGPPSSGLDFVQYVNRKSDNYDNEIETWQGRL